ncbi:uncharacterized protein LOC132284437 [Cornus florida]|uniref:uncharacterized protein LOC132284437 n=1 Tax=Cornus florida TaxID=4283 RepID=UPI00289C609B|nr:uncharacterized protein LOC132284437 [Cornus florida]
MGNYISCTLTAPTGKHTNRAIKVIFPTGQIQQFYQPIKAAELMLETPNCFLVNSQSIQMGRRFSALSADEDLEMANVYVMFPMKRLNSVVSAADMGVLFMAANSAAKRISGGNFRILPEGGEPPAMTVNESAGVPKLNLDDIEEYSSLEFKHRLSMCRSKKPLLETIAEEPVCSR